MHVDVSSAGLLVGANWAVNTISLGVNYAINGPGPPR